MDKPSSQGPGYRLVYLISDNNPRVQALSRNATARIQAALADPTTRSYDSMLRVFLAFSIFAHFDLHSLSTNNILCFLEFLASNKVSHSGISNYISAVKTKLSMYGMSVASFTDPRVRFFNKSLSRNAALRIKFKAIIDIPMLIKIAQIADSMYMGFMYKAAILLSFFSFLRISNLVPHSMVTFHPLKQLARGDVFFAPLGAHILLKWSKTMQMNNSLRILKIPNLGSSPIYPVKALKTSVLNKPFLVGPGMQWFQRAGTRVSAPMGDNS